MVGAVPGGSRGCLRQETLFLDDGREFGHFPIDFERFSWINPLPLPSAPCPPGRAPARCSKGECAEIPVRLPNHDSGAPPGSFCRHRPLATGLCGASLTRARGSPALRLRFSCESQRCNPPPLHYSPYPSALARYIFGKYFFVFQKIFFFSG